MPHRILPLLGTARIAAYQEYRPHYTENQIGELYVWHASLASAVHEVLGYCEVAFRNAIDKGLSQWNATHPRSSHQREWLLDPAPELRALIDPPQPKPDQERNKRSSRGRHQGRPVIHKARLNVTRSRVPGHPRCGAPITHDDLLAQLSFGELVHLMPTTADQRNSGFTPREFMWLGGVRSAFPNVDNVFPIDASLSGKLALVDQGRRVGDAADRLRVLRNRIAHYEQILTAAHAQRHRDAIQIVRAICPDAAAALTRISRVLDVANREP